MRKCQACHSLEPGKNLVGPSLASIVGRKADLSAVRENEKARRLQAYDGGAVGIEPTTSPV